MKNETEQAQAVRYIKLTYSYDVNMKCNLAMVLIDM